MNTPDHVALLISECLDPILDEFCVETGKGLQVKVSISGAEGIKELNLIANGSAAEIASGEIRVVTPMKSDRQTAFSLEGMFPGLFPETGFSGFYIRGFIDLKSTSVRVVARSNRYNVWKWSADFDF